QSALLPRSARRSHELARPAGAADRGGHSGRSDDLRNQTEHRGRDDAVETGGCHHAGEPACREVAGRVLPGGERTGRGRRIDAFQRGNDHSSLNEAACATPFATKRSKAGTTPGCAVSWRTSAIKGWSWPPSRWRHGLPTCPRSNGKSCAARRRL